MDFRGKIAAAFFMPREEFGDECTLYLAGERELRLSGRHRLLLCGEEEMRILVSCGGKRRVLSVTGQELRLSETGPDRTVLSGAVEAVQFLS